jgi:DNA-directed RNA polymerase specialized sigma24 family protein
MEVTGGQRRLAEEACEAAYTAIWQQTGRVEIEPDWDEGQLLLEIRANALALRPAPASEQRSEPAERAYMQAVVREGLAHMEPTTRRALELAYFGGMAVTDIAEVLGTPADTLRRSMREALLTLGSLTRGHQETVR